MCTVTLIARNNGYLLGMNRDEQRSRLLGLPPEVRQHHGVKVLYPSEPGGGTWIGVNEARVCFALINWYSVGRRVAGKAASRGQVVVQASRAMSPSDASALLEELPLTRTNPFRLIGIFLNERRVSEWRWDLEALAHVEHPWRARQWISSGHDEPGAEESRSRTFAKHLERTDAGTLDWLRRLHRSHSPARGAYSTCMHREDAVTVSYSEVSVTSNGAVLRYANGSPCRCRGITTMRTRSLAVH